MKQRNYEEKEKLYNDEIMELKETVKMECEERMSLLFSIEEYKKKIEKLNMKNNIATNTNNSLGNSELINKESVKTKNDKKPSSNTSLSKKLSSSASLKTTKKIKNLKKHNWIITNNENEN